MIYPSLPYCLCFAADATPSLATTNPEEVQSLFASPLDVFDPIPGQLNNADLARLHKDITAIILPLPYNVEKGINDLMGIVIDEDNYNQRYRAKLPTPTNPNFYNESTPNNATNVVRSKDEAVHTAKIVDYLLSAAAKWNTHDFIQGVI